MAYEDQTRHVTYAHSQAERQFDQYPPEDDAVPLAAAINAWTLICGCYMGIEQTMKLLTMMRSGVQEVPRCLRRHDGHDLSKLYSFLDQSEHRIVSDYYRVYRSLHNFDSGGVCLDTADNFITYIGNGYTSWRYILIEDPATVPKMHIGLLLETWRALVDIVMYKVHGKKCETLEHLLTEYFHRVVTAAEMDDDWQASAQDKNTSIDFGDVRKWICRNGGALKAGIDLLDRHARGNWHSLEASPLLRRVLARAVKNAVTAPTTYKVRRTDINTLLHRINGGGITWNAEKRAFD